jgi:hypothetical protein
MAKISATFIPQEAEHFAIELAEILYLDYGEWKCLLEESEADRSASNTLKDPPPYNEHFEELECQIAFFCNAAPSFPSCRSSVNFSG